MIYYDEALSDSIVWTPITKTLDEILDELDIETGKWSILNTLQPKSWYSDPAAFDEDRAKLFTENYIMWNLLFLLHDLLNTTIRDSGFGILYTTKLSEFKDCCIREDLLNDVETFYGHNNSTIIRCYYSCNKTSCTDFKFDSIPMIDSVEHIFQRIINQITIGKS